MTPSPLTRLCLGLWLLASSWVFGLDYFFSANLVAWGVFVALGTALVWASSTGAPAGDSAIRPGVAPVFLALAFTPAVFILRGPARLGPLLLVLGAGLELIPRAGPRLRAGAGGLTLSGIILLAQAMALSAYQHATARAHDLPSPLPKLLAGVARLFGADIAADGSDLVLSTMRQNHRLAATWEFFLDPGTLCFLVGLLAWFAVSRWSDAPASASLLRGRRREAGPVRRPVPAAVKATTLVLLAALVWLPLKCTLFIGVFLHRALRTDYEASLNLMDQFWSPWPQWLALLPLALLTARWLRSGPAPTPAADASWTWLRERSRLAVLAVGGVAAAALTLAVYWDPIGQRQAGRIAVDEFHTKWEPTDRPMDTEWYGHLSGYNYASLYDYCTRFYTMSRLTNSFTDAALANLDVLILKVPTEPYQPSEVDAVVRYVERGSGVLFIGEHTDVFNTSYHLNSIARRFGFEFRYDCLFGMQSFFDEHFDSPFVRHPVLQHVSEFDFATSCSIDPRRGAGRGVIVATGLKNSMADYHANNYYPQAADHAAMRAGAFVQLWATRHGRGRVLAFTDSTIFSNFSTFEPGKPELFLGMIEWLNRRDGLGNPRPWLLLFGAAFLAWGVYAFVREPLLRRPLVAAAALGWSVTSLALVAHQQRALPEPKPVRPFTRVTIDRTLSDGPLSKGGFIAGKADGFGIFERWILRLGYFIQRRTGLPALEGDLVVFFYPTRPVPPEFLQALQRYVEGGGKILVLDSPKNERSSAAALLAPFQLAQKPIAGTGGTVSGPGAWPAVPVEAAHEVTGGQTLFTLGGKPVGAVARRGQGLVVAIGFGSRFCDANMGVTGDVTPDAELRKVFDLQFTLLRAIIGNTLPGSPPG